MCARTLRGSIALPLLICILLVSMAGSSRAGDGPFQYKLTDLGSAGGTSTYAFGINDSGQVSGTMLDTAGNPHAFIYSSGTMGILPQLPGSLYSYGMGINASGEVIGYTLEGSTGANATIYNKSWAPTDLGTLGATVPQSYGYRLNKQGYGIGFSYNTSGYPQCFQGSISMPIAPFAVQGDVAFDINNSYQVAGSITYPYNGSLNSTAAWFDSNANPTAFLAASMPGANSWATAINNNAEASMVGYYTGAPYTSTALGFNYTIGASSFSTLSPPIGATGCIPYGINNAGVAVGAALPFGFGGRLNLNQFPYSNLYRTGHGAFWQRTNAYNANDLLSDSSAGYNVLILTGINSKGATTGWATSPGGDTHAIILAPTTSRALAPSTLQHLVASLNRRFAQNDLNWEDTTNGRALTSIQRSTDGTNWTQIGLADYCESSYTDCYPDSDMTYDYRIQAINSVGKSGYSNVVRVKTPAPVLLSLMPTVGYVNNPNPSYVDVIGDNFAPDCSVTMDGAPVSSDRESATELKVYFPALSFTIPGTHSIVVTYTGGSTPAQSYTVEETDLVLLKSGLFKNGSQIDLSATIANVGFVAADQVTITKATLDGNPTLITLPETLGNLQVQGNGTSQIPFTLPFGAISGTSGNLQIQGNYSGAAGSQPFAFSVTVKVH